MKSYQEFFAELKRRHVFRVAAIYGATSFVVLQLADLLVEALRLPPDFLTMITVLVLLGFPVALVLAWAFEVTPGGVKRTDAATREELEAITAEPASKRWPAGFLALLGVAALVLGAWWVGRSTALDADAQGVDAADESSLQLALADASSDDRPSIAVLPFADMSREGDQQYFSDGMTEEIVNTLAAIDRIRVSARTSAFAYREAVDMSQVGAELGVRYLLEGSVRKDGDDLRITAQLIDTRDASHIWTEQYDRKLESVFAIQTEIAEAIAEELRVPLGIDDAAELVRPVADFAAYDLYLAARGHMRRRGAAMTDAIRLYEAAIAIDSMWAPAWAGLAEATEIRLWHEENFGGLAPDTTQIREGLAAAERAARRALALDSTHASAHVALGNVLRDRFEWERGEASYVAALSLDPDNAEARHQYAELLLAMGRIEEGLEQARRAADLDPAPVRLHLLGFALWADGRPGEAERVLNRYVDASSQRGSNTLARLLYAEGRFEEARAAVENVAAPRWDLSDAAWERRVGWMRTGDPELVPASAHGLLDSFDWAMLGDPRRGAALRTQPSENDLEIRRLYNGWLPVFDDIRSQPVYQEYLRRSNLAGATVQRTPPEKRALEEPAP